MKKRVGMIAAVVLGIGLSGMVHAEWRPGEAPEPVPAGPGAFAQKADLEVDREMRSMEWRCVGPFVGVRGCGVAVHPTDKNRFYHAHSSGGVWMTEDNGQYWLPITDGQIHVGPVGAIALAPSNPDIIYIGTGEPQLRDCSTWGDGAYKSTDGGVTWTHIGLEKTKRISRVRVHPDNPDLVYMAAIGSPFGPSQDRGVYRSKDGGKSWKQVFFKHEQAGVIDLVLCEHDPTILYAATFEVFRRTWGLKAGGPNSGIFKSIDGGDTWIEITRNPGMATDDLGRIGLAHSKKAPERITALVDSKEKPGLYQSEDGGKTWAFVSDNVNIIQRPFYYMHLHASPHNGDELWVLSNKLWQSMDAGKTWVQRSGTKDDFHDMAFDPEDPDRMIITHDGGAMVTRNGGKTWSNPYTQPNQQVYRINVDNEFPYNLYGNNQDLIGYKVPSASIYGGISQADVTVIGSGESGASVPDPKDPNTIYHLAQSTFAAGGCPIQRVNLKTGQWEQVNVWPVITFGRGQNEAKYRFNWHAPVLFDPFRPKVLYTAAEVVFRSKDRGQSWKVVSPVLTRDDPEKQQPGGSPSSLETSGQEAYNTIHRMAASRVKKGVFWTGSDDGLIHVTKNNCRKWTNVTPPDLPEDSDVYEIEASPHDAGTAYVAVSRYRTANDFLPYLYKTSDYGETWTELSKHFPQTEITRTIREDTVRKGLLFVGTETGVFASLDDGISWKRLNLNLPAVPVHDMKIKDEDLCIATFGRSFWILDDISPLRQTSEAIQAKTAHLFKPRTHTRLGINWWALYGGGVGGEQKNYFVQNGRMGHTFIELGVVNGERKRKFLDAGGARPRGAIIYYLIGDNAKDVSLSVLDSKGELIKTYEGDTLSQEVGLNRMIWDMNYPDVVPVPGKPPAGIVVEAKPDTYIARLTVGGQSQDQSFELRMNPNETWSQKDADARFELWWRIRDIFEKTNKTIISAMETAEGAGEDSEIAKEASAFIGKLVPMGANLSQIANEPSKLLSKLQTVHWVLFQSEGRPPQSAYDVVDMLEKEIDAELTAWVEFLKDGEMTVAQAR
ncbi:WD40/YVTN/BNR-like repeat-containing protein [Desulfoluna spongiiphila]|uniref:WD40/YVTN/BNR-like repeat-containing protein n=1 Tax=Desulfoluna spongiiphila TaxID=419481 RepID=UPI00125A7819|nr:glycosyl hydrolase [Desulfoluna spongiiphila]VVS91813.1 consensus disorder prediction [Desulfoluna spongiiphila]